MMAVTFGDLTSPPSPRSACALYPASTSSPLTNARPSKRLSPSLELRLKRLDEQRWRHQSKHRANGSVGRIPEEQLEQLERRRRSDSVEVRRRGSIWAGPPVRVMPTSGGVRLSGGPVVLSETEQSTWESEVSSVISLGDRLVLSGSDDELAEADAQHKFRLPDVGKTRLHLLTKEPLSPPQRQREGSQPGSQPHTPRSTRDCPSPTNFAVSPRNNGRANASNENVAAASDSDFISSGLSRAGSIYSLSRVSFAGQLSQLTNMRLPDAASLAKRISSIPTSTEAAKTLSDASEQIRLWIGKAAEVLQGLNADDDVEWAAEGGREGIEDVDQAINRFEKLVDVYVLSIERLQTRADVAALSAAELTGSVKQMEIIISSWQKIKRTLKGVKEQVEIAMEWEELWNTVLGEIGQEMEGLNRLVFEMEEKRHEGAEGLFGSRDSIDLNDLEMIVEEQPGRGKRESNPFAIPAAFSSSSPMQPAETMNNMEESSLLALFARMQPLRASLDFLPMRLSSFHIRGNPTFPTACLDLEHRRDQLEAQWKKLENDAESLRRELGEDRWVIVFRNAGRQALKMCESVTRSYSKLLDAVDGRDQRQSNQNNPAAFAKMVESYQAKKIHYGPAIERVVAIIDRGVVERLTVNGEILRLQSETKRRWTALDTDMKEMDAVLEDIALEAKDKQLRDSVSTVLSSERSVVSSLVDTPGSSPASSVVGVSRKSSFQGSRTPTPLISTRLLPTTHTPSSAGARTASRLGSPSSIPRRAALSRRSVSDMRGGPSPAPRPSGAVVEWPSRPLIKPDNRPGWSYSTKPNNRDFAPLSKFEPSPYAKTPITPKTPAARMSQPASSRTPGSRIVSEPVKSANRNSVVSVGRKSSLPIPATPTTRTTSSIGHRRPPSSLGVASQRTPARKGGYSLLAQGPTTTDGNEADIDTIGRSTRRPPSSLENASRRSSMLPMRTASRLDDRDTSAGAERRPWRP